MPNESIAQTAIEPRHAARLLSTPHLVDLRFTDLPSLLEPGDLLVVNRTRVRAARLVGTKQTGGAIELLLTKRIDVERWEALVRPARRIRCGSRLSFGEITGVVLSDPAEGVITVRLEADGGDVDDLLDSTGLLPLPPYFTGTLEDPERYQTMFSKTVGSAAAPTAALHFTPLVVEMLGERGVDIAEVELEVGLDTFRPIAVESIDDHVMHEERYVVPEAAAEAIGHARTHGARVVAVGTTVVRTLESAATDGGFSAGTGSTGLFIKPGYEFKVVDGLVTNFHAPGTTLLVMLEALYPQWREAYRHALSADYRFLSFGDSMVYLP
ncbi:MAG: tRNA preQ1(34) S-adenosylmethionine ribosyltransferase-isomerase QueA [Acidimicrobiia bacterium]|nr:tRNA preQ1(34) S-adenosylmethionine ribosyltransferase-isomerase QueA [Acidimicrobiia bacterium]